jgi:class 3 adenylate cyclase
LFAGYLRVAERYSSRRILLAFRRERHRLDHSSRLTDQDLEKIGVASLGHRRRLLRGKADLNKPVEAPATTPYAQRFSASPPDRLALADPDGERRYLTAMFCDLVGSTSIAAGLDAEEWRDLVGTYVEAASAAVTEMGGRVAKRLGDGIMALFGHPIAQENDAERAVRAALVILRALAGDLGRRRTGGWRWTN